MSRCSNCGRESPRGASFCLSCGARLDPVGPVQAPLAGAGPGGRVGVTSPVAGATSSTPAGPAGLPGPVPCPICGGENQAGMNFCRLCGSSLAAPFDPAVGRANNQPAVLPEGPAFQPPAGRVNGQPQGPMQGAPPPPVSRLTPAPAERGAVPEMQTCHRCGGATQSGFAFCQHCGAMLPRAPASARGGQPSAVEPARDAGPVAGGGRVAPVPVPVPVAVRLPTPVPLSASAPRQIDDRPWGVLHSVRRDGTDGEL